MVEEAKGKQGTGAVCGHFARACGPVLGKIYTDKIIIYIYIYIYDGIASIHLCI